jgi:DNA replication protein DnaC
VVLPAGVGKSHLMNALVFEALKRGYTGWQRSTHRVLTELQAARADGTHRRRLQRLTSVDVLALDDFGLRPLSPEMAEDLYELIRERCERKALILTSNRALAEWPDAFANNLLASAALDRLTHHCHVLVIRAESYRQRGRRKEDRTPDLRPAQTPELDSWPTPR